MIRSIDGGKVMADTQEVLAHLDGRSNVKTGPVGTLGYCMGGGYALLAAGTFPDRVAAAASFHGGSLATDRPDSPHLLADRMRARLYVGVAEIDHTFDTAQKARLEDALTRAGVQYTLDVYKGARHGFAVTGVDISPASIRAAVEITEGLPCRFILADVREMDLPVGSFDAAVFLYGQAEVPAPDELTGILGRIRAALKPGAPLALELRVASAVPRTMSTGWHTGVDGLFGPGVQLILSERGWDAEAQATVERHHMLAAETGELTIIGGTARALEQAEWAAILTGAGFPTVEFHPGWDGLVFDDWENWQVAIVVRA
jgi:pimeloyl-ACP methyl ester carboxylesterase